MRHPAFQLNALLFSTKVKNGHRQDTHRKDHIGYSFIDFSVVLLYVIIIFNYRFMWVYKVNEYKHLQS